MVYKTEPLGIELHASKRSVLRASTNSFYCNIWVQFLFYSHGVMFVTYCVSILNLKGHS